MEKNDLALRLARRLMFKRNYRCTRIDCVFDTLGWETDKINLAGPKIAGDREKVWMLKKGLECRGQFPILARMKNAGQYSYEHRPGKSRRIRRKTN